MRAPPRRRPRLRRLVLRAASGSIGLVVAFLVADALFPFPERTLRRPPSRVVEARDGAPLRIRVAPDGRFRLPLPLGEISPEFKRAVVASEDRWFRWHPGVNPFAIVRAAVSNASAGRRVSGASTIPMQIARMAERRPRTLRSKAVEAFRALQLVAHHSKDELLEIYLNMIPCGGNLEGVGAGSWFWFDKTPSQVSLGEAALLAVLPRSPTRYNPARHPNRARAARDALLDDLASRADLTAEVLAAAKAQPVPASRRPVPFQAPHFAAWALARASHDSRLRTTLDVTTQAAAEGQVAAHIADLRRAGVGNAAVVVIENDTRALRAMVGSAGFRDGSFSGEINGAVVPRSPGSALKPFLYALAFDDGRIVPDSLLLDVPTDYAGYVAENFDGAYHGDVVARDALVRSLNAPAVRLLADTGIARLLGLLRRGGLDTLADDPDRYGLALILGVGDVRLIDVTALYASLAAGGEHRPVRWLASAAPPAPVRLVSRESAWLVTDILTELRRPDFPEAWDLVRDVPAVAWKTGTSYGHRDAWAVGFSSRYTVGVWVGNFDATGRQGITGAEHAAPLLFDVFRAIEGNGSRLARPEGLDLAEVVLCRDSRDLALPSCPATVRAAAIPGRSHLRRCERHRPVFVDARLGTMLTPDCLDGRTWRRDVATVLPPELAAWMRAQGRPLPAVPPPDPACGPVASTTPPRIVSPNPSTPYRVRRDAPLDDQRIPLVASAGENARTLYWYEDGRLVLSAPPGETRFVEPRPGTHRLVVVDDAGRSDQVRYRVE